MTAQTLRIAVRKFAPFEDAIRRQFTDFARNHAPGAQMEFDSLELNDLQDALFKNHGLKTGRYDICFMVTDWLADAVENGLLADLSTQLRSDPPPDYPAGWSPSLTAMPAIRGGLFGLPYHDGPECLIYRTDLVATPPKTWDEFLATMRRVASPTDGLFGTVVAAYPDGHNIVYDYCLHLWARGGALLDEAGIPSLNTPAALDAIAFYRALVKNPATVPGARTIDSVSAGNQFMAGQVAMMVNWFGFAAMCQMLENSAVRGKVAIAPIPAAPGGHAGSLNVYWMLSIAAGSSKKEFAWQFLRHCCTVEMDKLLTLTGGVGCRLSTWKDPEINQRIPFFASLPEIHQNARSFPVDRRFPGLAHAIERGVLRAIDTDDEAERITQQMQADAMAVWKGHSS